MVLVARPGPTERDQVAPRWPLRLGQFLGVRNERGVETTYIRCSLVKHINLVTTEKTQFIERCHLLVYTQYTFKHENMI